MKPTEPKSTDKVKDLPPKPVAPKSADKIRGGRAHDDESPKERKTT